MAERREVLELGSEDEIEEIVEEDQADEQEPGEDADKAEIDEDDESEEIPAFEGEEAAPASEGESSVIREMRGKIRELTKRNAELERGGKPQKIEVGDKPTLESCEYDEERFETELDAWKGRKAKAAQQDQEEQERTETERSRWEERAQAYEANKTALNVADYADAEGEVFTVLSEQTQALIMLTEKPAALIYALSRNPAKLEELSKLDLARAAMTIGKLEDKLTVTKRRLPDPDRPVRGNAAPVNADKELARLEAEADKTGDRSKIAAYNRKKRRA